MRRVLFVKPDLQPPGGANAVATWMLEALKKDYSVSLLTWKPPDFEEINRYYGTSLQSSQLTIHWINPVVRGLINLDPDPGSIQKLCYLLRVCKRWNKRYDVLLSAEDEVDFGRKGIQYLHYPTLYKKIRPFLDVSGYKKVYAAFKGHYRPWMWLSGFSCDRMRRNLTLVNSDWTGAKVRELYGIESLTVYPPVPGNFPDIPWEKRENGFVCIGRIHPHKRFERIVEILAQVRSVLPRIHLHMVGAPLNRRPEERNYSMQILKLARENASWIFFHENLSREELVRLLACHRYGIHAYEDEHFGIAVAEMVKAGCITFVPDGGGQVEIVGKDTRLRYQTPGEAVKKIVRVMESPVEQADVCAALSLRKGLFSTENFMDTIREIVGRFLKDGPE